jgi:NADH-quinone oxidoreductase subunit J
VKAILAFLVLVAIGLAARPVAAQTQPRPEAATRDARAAQPHDDHAGHDHGPVGGQPGAAAGEPGAAAGAHGEVGPAKGFENGTAAALLFWVLAFATVGGAVFVITRRNLVAAVMGMVGTFFALAALYAMLYAHFLAAIQVLVYAGAIMVLFVFVVMILNRPEDEPWALQGLLGKALAGLAILYLVVRLSGVLWGVKDTPHAVVAAPRPQSDQIAQVGTLENPSQAILREDDWGSTRAVGKALFRDYLFPFEAVSLVLLVAVVGGIALSRPHREPEPE